MKDSKVRVLQQVLQAVDSARFVKEPDGSVTVLGVPILTEGVWTDSAQKTPAFYPRKALQESTWDDASIWLSHPDGQFRNILDKVGLVVNQRFDGGMKGVIGDLNFHMKTANSRDALALIEGRVVDAVSPEHRDLDHFDRAMGCDVVDRIIFTGLAIVPKGACADSRIFQKCESYEPPQGDQEDDGMNDEEKAAQAKSLADLETRLMAKVEEARKQAVDGAEEKVRKMGATIEEQANAVKALEKELAEQKQKAMQGAVTDEVGQPKYNIDLKTGLTQRW